jgi:hypothetical protein
MPADLTDNYVANTYKGVLHVNGEELPADTKVQVYDGAGNETAIKLGSNSVDCLSLSAQGLTANNFKYPDVPGNSFSVLTQVSDSAEGEVNILELKNIQDIFCGANAGASYNRVSDSAVPVIQTQCGLVRSAEDVEITSITEAAGGLTTNQTGIFTISTVNIRGGIVRELTLSPLPTTTPPPTPYKAFANVIYNGSLGVVNGQGDQGTDFTIVGQNISQIRWIKRGLYRVTFTTPALNTNYIPIVQNVVTATQESQWPNEAFGGRNQVVCGENSMIIGFKSTTHFEFACWSDDADRAENMQACGILVI